MFHEPDTFGTEPVVPMLSGRTVEADRAGDSTGKLTGAELGGELETERAGGAAVSRAGPASRAAAFAVASDELPSASGVIVLSLNGTG
jgi:hypothetical protein